MEITSRDKELLIYLVINFSDNPPEEKEAVISIIINSKTFEEMKLKFRQRTQYQPNIKNNLASDTK